MPKRILIVEDEPTIADNIRYALSTDGYEPLLCATGAEALEIVRKEQVDLAIIDVGLPDMIGFDLCKSIRLIGALPIIFVTARAEEVDRVVGLEIGADDYVVKPFSPRELSARVRAVLRRTSVEKAVPVEGFEVDTDRYEINYNGKPLELSRYEFRLLNVLMGAPGKVFTREQLMNRAWEDPDMSLERTVDSHIKSIRLKLREAGADPELIETHRGIGYSLKA